MVFSLIRRRSCKIAVPCPVKTSYGPIASIPKLADFANDPSMVEMLPREAIPVFLGDLERLKSSLWVRLVVPQGNGREGHSAAKQLEPAIIDSKELARRWNVPESWVRDSVRSRSGDPIPCVHMGRYVRFEWGSVELEAWYARRKSSGKNQPDRTKNHLTRIPIAVYP